MALAVSKMRRILREKSKSTGPRKACRYDIDFTRPWAWWNSCLVIKLLFGHFNLMTLL
jgi:hypothetical protein